ncbi:phosphorelay protein LuxU [Vibrio gazogenes]|uniref:Phosphorelay protein LuxU n=2 Tax=Vibrio gazogenes TaxID=687 RepID=A0A1Z2SHM7_VIBGA|nr:quorum-sensing phosphorelay protein LuxU [Vibrio gazogenes]ASA56681.1 phosphorelay protein LuxU [Vibrio gazogenes]
MSEIMNQATISSLSREIGEDNIPVLLDIFLGELENYQATLSESAEQEQLELLKEISHALKSSAASFGADRLCDMAIDIDTRGKQGLLLNTKQEKQNLIKQLRETYTSYMTLVQHES